MTTYNEQIIPGSSRIIASTNPGRANVYLDGEAVMSSSGQIEKTPIVIYNVSEGFHSVTFGKEGYNSVTIGVNVPKASDCHARALLNTSMFAYPMMMSNSNQLPDQSNICEMLKSAVDDEFNAILEYSSLLKAIDTKYYETVKDILEDETEHFNELGKIVEEIKCSETLPVSAQPSPGWTNIRRATYGGVSANTSPEGAEIYLDGKPVLDINGDIATTPSSLTRIISGTHTVTFKKAGYVDTDVIVNIQGNLYSDARATLQQKTT